ncbi:acyl carrier protein phosphodiesterase [Bordetella ansorpii]|uniref:FMN dependent NADH:quinone oxidoreductase n=1 Tax=Bordetella ansorpii TaxID=288768 RepID=A0A157S8B2_9BORD|nr:NAD(P)H-dependent oxidoreductase [Bordetella ansorpii]SAI66156.1 acyl carrier protein phosphodiesterase [Bordetella ansorpii]
MNILHMTFSPRGADSESTRLSRIVLDALLDRHPAAAVQSHDHAALAHVDAVYAVELGTPQPPADAIQPGTLRTSDALIRDLEAADCVVIGTPMHNYTVPSALKAWIDHVVRVRRTFQPTPQGKVGTLHDRPIYVATSSGGLYSGENARQPDFLTPYLKVALRTIGLTDMTFFSVEGTAYGEPAVMQARASAQAAIAAHFATPDAAAAA